jgi:hypothetical protein
MVMRTDFVIPGPGALPVTAVYDRRVEFAQFLSMTLIKCHTRTAVMDRRDRCCGRMMAAWQFTGLFPAMFFPC